MGARTVAAAASAAAGLAWLAVWWHQRLAHGPTSLNEKEVVLGLTWMDSGKLLVLPLLLFLAALVALRRSLPRPGRPARLGYAASVAALVALAAGTALEFWPFAWGSYAEEFEEASIGAGGALQALAAPLLAVTVIPFAVALARARVLPAWAAPLPSAAALGSFWLTPANPLPGLALLALGLAASSRQRRDIVMT